MRLKTSYINSYSLFHFALMLEYSLFHSLEGNEIGVSGVTALADGLRVNQSLTTLE